MIWNDNNTITIEPPKKPKKITGTRLGAILGFNKWSTPFEAWCAITRTYEKPFEDNIYTTAGKVIEPVLIDFVAKRYFLDVQTPEDIYGKDFFKKTWGDFFHENKILGGMWDALADDTIIEIKTTKRAEDWVDNIPEYYKLQAGLYAYLKGASKVIFCCGFLTDKDYEHPENFKPVVGENVIIREFNMADEYPNFEQDYIRPAERFWANHVVTGVSPEYTDKDAEIIKELRKTTVDSSDDLQTCISTIEELMASIDAESARIKPLETQLKKEQDKLKKYLTKALEASPDKDKAEVKGASKVFTLSKTVKKSFDDKAFKAEHTELYNKYAVDKTTYTLRNSSIKA